MRSSESYLDVVWRQFKKNRPAYWSLWLLAPLFAIAIFAPVLASNQPFVYFDGTQYLFPWFRALFNPAYPVDFLFNMALLALPLALPASLVVWRMGKTRDWHPRRRLGRGILIYLALIVAAVIVFGLIPGTAPRNTYWARTFPLEQFDSGGTRWGIYPPIPFGPTEPDLNASFRPPLYRSPREQWLESNDGFVHLLGTDDNGRDVLVRMIYGARVAMTVGFVAVGIYLSIGVVVGAIAGYFGGITDAVISRIIEVVLLFPAFFLILTLVALLGQSIYIIMVVIGLTGWPTIARLIRGEVLKQRSVDYVLAAQALGSSHRRIIFRHILPNAISPALVAAPFGIAGAIITEAGLSLLGFGVRPPAPSWGALLQLGQSNYAYWWLVLFPSLAIFMTVTIFNLVGNGLRDAMDPRLRM